MTLKDDPVESFLARYSDRFQLLKSAAWLIRFKTHLQTMTSRHPDQTLTVGLLKPLNIKSRRKRYSRRITTGLREAVEVLQKENNKQGPGSQSIPPAIAKLNPVLFNAFICVGGRVNYSSQCESVKHPVILPGAPKNPRFWQESEEDFG